MVADGEVKALSENRHVRPVRHIERGTGLRRHLGAGFSVETIGETAGTTAAVLAPAVWRATVREIGAASDNVADALLAQLHAERHRPF